MCNFIVIITKLFIYGKTNYKKRLLGFLFLIRMFILYITAIHILG